MEALYILIPLSLVLVAVAIWVFFVAADGGQFDDLEGPALRILRDDDSAVEQSSDNQPVVPACAGTTG